MVHWPFMSLFYMKKGSVTATLPDAWSVELVRPLQVNLKYYFLSVCTYMYIHMLYLLYILFTINTMHIYTYIYIYTYTYRIYCVCACFAALLFPACQPCSANREPHATVAGCGGSAIMARPAARIQSLRMQLLPAGIEAILQTESFKHAHISSSASTFSQACPQDHSYCLLSKLTEDITKPRLLGWGYSHESPEVDN